MCQMWCRSIQGIYAQYIYIDLPLDVPSLM